jgi:hypothetical protein
LHLHAVSGDLQVEHGIIHAPIGLQSAFVVVAATHQCGRKPRMPVFEDQVRLFELHGRRIRHREDGIVEAQPALQASLPGIAQRAVHEAVHLQLGRQLRTHVARQFQDGRHGKPVPVQ